MKYTIIACCILALSCNTKTETKETKSEKMNSFDSIANERIGIYETVKLTADLSKLKPYERQMLPLLIEAAKIMDGLFWKQAYGDKDALLKSIKNATTRKFAEINYGPWDRLNDDNSFVEGFGKKPDGANIYPKDATKEELEKSNLADKKGLYSVVKRDKAGKLYTVPYHEEYKAELTKASELLLKAAALS